MFKRCLNDGVPAGLMLSACFMRVDKIYLVSKVVTPVVTGVSRVTVVYLHRKAERQFVSQTSGQEVDQ